MPRPKSLTLTEAELRIMQILWEKQRATVAEVTAAMPTPPIAYNSVLTTMRILEQKGFVAHDDASRAFTYFPIVEREAAAQTAVGHVLTRFFSNSSSALALKLIETERPSKDELQRLKSLIEAYEEKA